MNIYKILCDLQFTIFENALRRWIIQETVINRHKIYAVNFLVS